MTFVDYAVLVIIGLLLGGILKGQEMITQAKIKNVIADISGVSAAMYGYQDRYRALPGDDKLANRWSGVTVPGTAGDGTIEGTYIAAATAESMLFWDHLRRAGFISGGSGADNPFNAVNGKMGVQTSDGTAPTSSTLPMPNRVAGVSLRRTATIVSRSRDKAPVRSPRACACAPIRGGSRSGARACRRRCSCGSRRRG